MSVALTVHGVLLVHRFEIERVRLHRLTVGKREIVGLVKTPVAKQSSGPVLRENKTITRRHEDPTYVGTVAT